MLDIDSKRAYYYLMKILANTNQQTKAKPEAIFSLWRNIDDWAEHDKGIEWAKLTDSFVVGGCYTIKPKGGPKVKAIITEIEQNKKFVDVSQLPGAKLKFDHTIVQQGNKTMVAIVMTISGPLSLLWAKILGKNQQTDLEQATANLIKKAEASS